MANGNGEKRPSSGGSNRWQWMITVVISLCITVAGIATAWGVFQERVDNCTTKINKIEAEVTSWERSVTENQLTTMVQLTEIQKDIQYIKVQIDALSLQVNRLRESSEGVPH